MIANYSKRTHHNINYNRSEKLALKNGFEVVFDGEAYNGRYFMKDGKKWIHNISALKSILGISRDSMLEEYGYDVRAYYNSH